MNKENLEQFKIIILLIIILIPLILWGYNKDKKAMNYCMNQGYSYDNCRATLEGYR